MEEKKLGSGGFGAVFLCRHLLQDVDLGLYAGKGKGREGKRREEKGREGKGREGKGREGEGRGGGRDEKGEEENVFR